MTTIRKTRAITLGAAAFVAAAGAALSLSPSPAEAKHKSHVTIVLGGGGGGYYGPHWGGPCRWLKRRAIMTGSPYWWNRYHACRWGY
jgi:hypothetical protein